MKDEIEAIYDLHGSRVGRLMNWLQSSQQGVHPTIAARMVHDVGRELIEAQKVRSNLVDNKVPPAEVESQARPLEYWRDPLFYPQKYRERLAEGRFADVFWIENYVLQRCLIEQDRVISSNGHGPGMADLQLKETMDAISRSNQQRLDVAIDKMTRHFSNSIKAATAKVASDSKNHITSMVIDVRRDSYDELIKLISDVKREFKDFHKQSIDKYAVYGYTCAVIAALCVLFFVLKMDF